MKRLLRNIRTALLALFGFALLTASVHAQSTFVYTNNDNNFGQNSVSAFSVNLTPGPLYGTLSLIGTFMTGGTGSGAGTFSAHRIIATRNFLYASNYGSNDISAFSIDTATGGLTLLGSPVATGEVFGPISMAATPNGRFLYARAGNTIKTFSIGPHGALTPIGSPVPAHAPAGMKVTPDGKFLTAALAGSNAVGVFSIDASTGALTSVPSSPFGSGGYFDVDINCRSNRLFAGWATGGSPMVSVFTIAPNGVLTEIAGSPFTFTPGAGSGVDVLSPDNQHLFVSNQSSNTITTLDVASGGSLTQETDSPSGPSPFLDPGVFGDPGGMATNREGTLLYVVNAGDNTVTGFHIDGDGGLTLVGPPVPTGGNGRPRYLAVFPSKAVEGEGKMKDEKGHEDDFNFEAEHECEARGEMEFKERETGEEMHGSVDAVRVSGSQATMSGSGTLADGTRLNYTAVVLGNAPVVGVNLFAISWITATGSVFQTSGALTNGYIAVH
jgi:6-phosphogluconolactonase (cycloisomerase 2 family)